MRLNLMIDFGLSEEKGNYDPAAWLEVSAERKPLSLLVKL